MKLKRFVASDTRSAIQQIKATLGSDAVILSSSRVEGGIEVVAAVDFDERVLATTTAIATAESGQRVPEDIKMVTRHQLIAQFSNQELTLSQMNDNGLLSKLSVRRQDRRKKCLKKRSVHQVHEHFEGSFFFEIGQWQFGKKSNEHKAPLDVARRLYVEG